MVKSGVLGVQPITLDKFQQTQNNAILDASDSEMKNFAQQFLGYKNQKGLDFIARFNKKYIIGETKFLTAHGGHQNAQLNDAITLLNSDIKQDVIKVAILDGVCYVKNKNKLYKTILEYQDKNIFSSLLLRDFLYQV